MKSKILLFIAVTVWAVYSFAQTENLKAIETVELDANKPIYLHIKTENLGPDFQCYYGFHLNETPFSVLFNLTPLNRENDFYFSNVYKFENADWDQADGYTFTSSVECWVLGDNKDAVTQAGEFSVQLFQDQNGRILFKDSFKGFYRVSVSDLWRNLHRENIRRVRFKVTK